MNAKEQYEHYSRQLERDADRREALHARDVIGAIQSLEAYSLTLAQKILSDLKLKIQAYGDKAFPMTEKQEEAVKRGLKEEFDRLQELTRQYNAEVIAEKAAVIETSQPAEAVTEDESMEELAQWMFGKTIDEISEEVAAENPPWQPGELNNMLANLDTREDQFLSVTEAAERAGVNRSFIKAEIKAGRLAAKKIGNQYAIHLPGFIPWLNSPKRGSRQ